MMGRFFLDAQLEAEINSGSTAWSDFSRHVSFPDAETSSASPKHHEKTGLRNLYTFSTDGLAWKLQMLKQVQHPPNTTRKSTCLIYMGFRPTL